MTPPLVRLSVHDGVADLVLDRAGKRNAITTQMLLEIREAIRRVSSDPGVRVLTVSGAGGMFSAGADIAEWHAIGAAQAEHQSRLGREVFRELAGLDAPSIAAIEGAALGGGLELALACDIRVTTTEARLGLPEVSLGNLPGWGGIARLIDIAGIAVARRMILTAEIVDGEEAARRGIVSTAVAPDRVDGEVHDLVGAICAADMASIALAKSVFAGFVSDTPSEPGLAGLSAVSEASQARKQAFIDRRRSRAQRKEA